MAWQLALAGVFALVMLAAAGRIVLAAAAGISPVVPASPHTAGWLRHITGEHLTYGVFLSSVVAFALAYCGLLPLARRLPRRALIALIAVLYLIVFVGPILVSTDVFSYIAYARMGVLHGLNPYITGPFAIRHDPVYPFVGTDWIFVPTAYGSLYTLFSYPFALLGLAGAVWGMKTVALLACVALAWLTWRCARLRGVDPKLALLIVAANPLVVIYTLASAQNDLMMIAVMVFAVYLAIPRRAGQAGPGGAQPGTADRAETAGASVGKLREALSGGGMVAAALIKAPAVAVLPFMVVGRRRLVPIVGAAVALVISLGAAYAVFGSHGVDILSGANRDAAYVSGDSFATQIAHMLGKPGVFPVDHFLLRAGLVALVLYLLVRVWRGYDWLDASGWALLGMSVTSTWLQPWYLLWPLPLAAVSRDRRLLWATLLIQALFVIHQLSPLFTPQ